jgi:AcrR family transcriptional regulator
MSRTHVRREGGVGEGLAGTAALRRRPVQRRSRERVSRLLDACAEVLDEVGYDALTTREVAYRAEVPIGTLYQFFADRQALCRALAERNPDGLLARLEARAGRRPVTTWAAAGRLVVEEYAAMRRTVPGFGVVDFGDTRPGRPHLLDPSGGAENNDVVAARLRAFGVDVLGLPAPEGVEAVLRVTVEIADALLRRAFRDGADGDPVLRREVDRVVEAYLAARLDAGDRPG